jgi:hypothetical protein
MTVVPMMAAFLHRAEAASPYPRLDWVLFGAAGPDPRGRHDAGMVGHVEQRRCCTHGDSTA